MVTIFRASRRLTDAASTYFNYIDFQGVGGPNQLSGIRTSKITPSYHLQQREPSHHAHGRQIVFRFYWPSPAASWAAT